MKELKLFFYSLLSIPFNITIITRSSADNFLISIPVPDWLIYCVVEIWYFIDQKNENDKNMNFSMKSNKKMSEQYT